MNSIHKKPKLHPDWIDPHALGIVRALQNKGHKAYLVGGCVRDLLIGIIPKDFDIATTAQPGEVRSIIYKAYVIGKRFRLVLVKRDEQVFEVATFRREPSKEEMESEEFSGDNVFGTAEEDARRRDFTVNGLFYDPVNDELIDYVNGVADLDRGLIRMIGDPDERLKEDPIRILRAIRLAYKIRFSLDPSLREGIERQAHALLTSALPRRREEFLKFLRLQDPSLPFLEAYDLGVLKHISLHIHQALDSSNAEEFLRYLRNCHEKNLDLQNPVELFGFLVQAYFRTQVQSDPHLPVRSKDILESPELQALMRDEMGMFKQEQSLVAKAMHLQPLLLNCEEFDRKGERRQLAFLAQEAFPTALKFAEKDYLITGQDYHFWISRYRDALPEIHARQVEKRRRKSRRRRPRRPRPPEIKIPSES